MVFKDVYAPSIEDVDIYLHLQASVITRLHAKALKYAFQISVLKFIFFSVVVVLFSAPPPLSDPIFLHTVFYI